jgi:hypothetical protein
VTIRSSAIRGAVAVVALVLLAGTVLAADPSTSPNGSPDASAAGSATTSTSPSESAVASAEASPVPAASEKPKESEPAEASEAPEASEPHESPEAAEAQGTEDGPPSADEIARIVGRLQDAGIPATAAQVGDLAGKVGVGGAVRVLAFAQASGKTPAQILAMFEGGKGWGQIDHELKLSIGPGIGWIMGNGHGKGHDKHPKPQVP